MYKNKTIYIMEYYEFPPNPSYACGNMHRELFDDESEMKKKYRRIQYDYEDFKFYGGTVQEFAII